MNIQFDFHAKPSFCNAWPLIAVEANGQRLFCEHIEYPQTIKIEFPVLDSNEIFIKYLNKNHGPEIWDTVTDESGKIIQDQHCIISSAKVGRSRCDFLIDELIFHGDDGTMDSNLYGFMYKKGHFQIDFPGNVYDWILDKRKQKIFKKPEHTSSLDYWTNYIGDNSHSRVDELVSEIKTLLKNL